MARPTATQRRVGARFEPVCVALTALQKSKACGPAQVSYTPIGYQPEIVGQKRRNEPRLTHDHASPQFQARFRTRTGEMSTALLAPARTPPRLTHDP